jgi:catechol 2,3-dioxygenase-like lactoylglutathione lyase family enzyme
MEIARVILRCADLDRAVQFWGSAVGLELIRRSESFAFFAAGSTELLLTEVPPHEMVPSLTEVVFAVDDVHGTHRRLGERGVPFEVEPRPVMTEGNRQLLATHFRDPDGNLASVTGWVVDP